MSITYHVYAGNSTGGPVDYTTIVTTTSSLSAAMSALPLSSQTRFAVRAYDTVSGLEEQNLDAQVLIVVDGSGNDVTSVPAPVAVPSVRAGAAASLVVTWFHPGLPIAPTGFRVYLGTPTPSYGSPAATVAGVPGQTTYLATLTGLTDGTTYGVTVRAYNASGEEQSIVVVTAAAVSTPPANVAGLTATLVP